MKKLFIVLMFGFLMACSSSKKETYDRLKFLVGTWGSTSNISFYERWELLNDSTMRGLGFSINAGDTLFNEQLYIQRIGEKISYVAIVWEQNHAEPVLFLMVDAGRKKFIFENPEHDYPNRIIYEKTSDSSMHIRIESMKKTKGKDFYMKKI